MPEERQQETTSLFRRGVMRALEGVLETRIVRAGLRYYFGHAFLFTGGITWSALLSITAAVTILVNVGRAFLHGQPEIFRQILVWVNDTVPGLFTTPTEPGVLNPYAFVVNSWLSPVTIISSIVALWSAVSVMTGLRRGLRAMFGLAGTPLPIHLGKLRDLLGFIGIGLAVMLSALLTTIVGFFGRPLLRWLHLNGSISGDLLLAGVLLATILLDWLVFIMLIRVVAAAHVPRKDLFLGALLGALLTGGLRQLGSTIVNLANDPVVASVAAVTTLAILISLMARVALFVAAWMANPPRPPLIYPTASFHHKERPNYVTRSAPSTLAWPHHPVTGSLIPTDPDTGEIIAKDTPVEDDDEGIHF